MVKVCSRILLTGTICGSWLTLHYAHAATTHHRKNAHSVAPSKPVKVNSPHKAVAVVPDPEAITVQSSRAARDGGGGMMRIETAAHSVQSVGRQYIAMRSPTSTGLDLIQNLPSVSVASPDTSGFKGGAIYIRGLTDSDMALLLDGAPDSLAAYLQQNVDPENIESVNVTPGSSPVDAPASNAAAGSLDERTITPSKKMGGTVDFSYGTNNLSREFIRLESGYIGHSGIRGYISFSNAHARQWMGSGINERKHVDFGLQKDFARGSTMKLFASWHNSLFTIDSYPTVAQFYNYKHTGDGYMRSGVWNPSSANAGNYWKSNLDSWNQIFVSAPMHFVLTKKLDFDLTPYFSTGFGFDGSSGGTVSSFGAGSLHYQNGQIASANQQLSTYWYQKWSPDVGFIAKLGYQIDHHNKLTFGYWYENNAVSYGFPYLATMPDGRNPTPNNSTYKLYTASGQQTTYMYKAGYELNSFFIEDVAKYFNNKLVITPGFKYVMSNYWDAAYGLSSYKIGANSTAPLPHLSISYQLNDQNQIYLNAEGDFRQPSPSALSNSTSMPKNQYSITEQIGYRFNNKWIMFDISAFNTSITNRLLSIYLPNTAYATTNAGNQTIRGFDALIAGREFHHFSPYASVEYLHGTFDSNVPYGSTYLPTKGKQSILTPRVMANLGITYNSSGFFGNFSLHYTGPQSVTLVDDQRMPGFVTDTLALGYHFKPYWLLKSPTFRMNFSNLTGSIVRVGTTGAVNNYRAVTLLDGTTVAGGSGATFYVQPRFTMTGTISTDF